MIRIPLILFFATLLCSCQDSSGHAPQITVPLKLLKQPATVQQGAALFLRYCRECHGTLSEGRNPRASRFHPPAPDFHNPYYAGRDPGYLFWRISQGKGVEPFFSQGSVMPAFGPHFSEQQIWQLVAYLVYRSQTNPR